MEKKAYHKQRSQRIFLIVLAMVMDGWISSEEMMGYAGMLPWLLGASSAGRTDYSISHGYG